MAGEGCWLLLQKCSGSIIDCFETASIEMNVTKQTGLILIKNAKLTATILGRMASRDPLYNFRLWKIAKFQN